MSNIHEVMIGPDGYLTTDTRLAPLYWRIWKAATLAWSIWDLIPGDSNDPFDNISLRTAITVAWGVHHDSRWINRREHGEVTNGR